MRPAVARVSLVFAILSFAPFWVAEGKTNGDVATILSSSRRTVEKHVEHILEKLGVENRATAARVAAERLLRGE